MSDQGFLPRKDTMLIVRQQLHEQLFELARRQHNTVEQTNLMLERFDTQKIGVGKVGMDDIPPPVDVIALNNKHERGIIENLPFHHIGSFGHRIVTNAQIAIADNNLCWCIDANFHVETRPIKTNIGL